MAYDTAYFMAVITSAATIHTGQMVCGNQPQVEDSVNTALRLVDEANRRIKLINDKPYIPPEPIG